MTKVAILPEPGEDGAVAGSASRVFSFVPWQGIPCYAARFGTEVEAAVRAHWIVCTSVYYNADAMDLECDVSDEGSSV